MTGTEQKLKVPDRAAYQPLQPLFEALGKSIDNLVTQTSLQRIHLTHDKDHFDQCVRLILDSWKNALENYHRVFETLSELTKPRPGNVETSSHHAVFDVLTSTTSRALNQLSEHHPTTADGKQAKGNGSPASSSSDHDPPDVRPSNKPGTAQYTATEGSPPKKRRLSAIQSSAQPPPGNKTRNQPVDDQSNGKVTPATPKSTSITTQSSAKEEDPKHSTTPEQEPTSTATVDATPEIQTEDISAAVEARLMAKAEKRRRLKESKKRKRASMDSNAAAEARGEMPEPSNLPERPKKKAKVSTSSEANKKPKPSDEKKAKTNHAARNVKPQESIKRDKRRISATEEAAPQAEGETKRRKKAKLWHS